MSVWEKYPSEQRNEYIKFLQVYGALSNLFRQKKGELIPYLDSKFQETVFAKTFNGQNVDIGNTPHDIMSIFGTERIGIGLKTWMGSQPSFQKVMQLKKYQDEINEYRNNIEDLAYKISEIRNEKMLRDYKRLGLSKDNNIYHYVTRDQGSFTINECAYPLIALDNLKKINLTKTAFYWSDGLKDYKYTFGDSQIWQKFDSNKYKSLLLNTFKVEIIDDPFSFLIEAYFSIIEKPKEKQEFIEVYLPLYSFRSKEVEEKSGLNAWNAAPKSKGSSTPRPLNEVYIPIPKEFHIKFPDFFTKDIINIINIREGLKGEKNIQKPEVRFNLNLPNGKKIPALLTGDFMKNFQSGSNLERDENGIRYGQSALGQWLLVDGLGLKERKLVTREWLQKKETDSVRLWRKKEDYSTINIDFAPIGAFEAFMNNEPIPQEDE